MEENIKVFIRVRPLSVDNELQTNINGNQIAVQVSGSKNEIRVESPTRHIQCRYDHVFDQESSQAEIYERVRSSVNAVLQGINSTLFAYGQTGSGKTYTMMGRESCIFDEPGIVPRCINDIFQFATRISDDRHSFAIYVSFIQVYNEQVYDMLDDPKRMKPLVIHETIQGSNISIPGLTEYHVHSYKQCLALIELGLKNRAIRETAMNNASSRSHSILQLTVEQSKPSSNGGFGRTAMQSKLKLVDLAGSERWSVNHGRGMGDGQISELTNINSSLYTLGRCIAALAEKSHLARSSQNNKTPNFHSKHIHVPYRDSKLTRLLQDSLRGNSKIFLLATINPSFSCSDESISTLRFADRAHQVMTSAQVNENVTQIQDVHILQQEIVRLKNLLRFHGINDTQQQQTQESYVYDNEEDFDFGSPTSLAYNRDTNISLPVDRGEHKNIEFSEEDMIHVGSNDCHKGNEDRKYIASTFSPSQMNKKACEKIIDALDMAVTTIDSFLKTMTLSNSTPDPTTVSHMKVENDSDQRNETLSSIVSTKQQHFSNGGKINFQTTFNASKDAKCPKESSKILTSLLKQRKELQGLDSKEEMLKQQLQVAKKQKKQKLQLHKWLLEKEENSQYPQRKWEGSMD